MKLLHVFSFSHGPPNGKEHSTVKFRTHAHDEGNHQHEHDLSATSTSALSNACIIQVGFVPLV